MSALEINQSSEIAMTGTLAARAAADKTPFYRKLYGQVLIAVAIGAALGYAYPDLSGYFKPYGDAFVRAIKVVVAPIIFTTIVVGIAKMGDIRRVANVGVNLFRGRVHPRFDHRDDRWQSVEGGRGPHRQSCGVRHQGRRGLRQGRQGRYRIGLLSIDDPDLLC